MKKLIIILSLMLSACASTQGVSVKQPWPEVPDELKQVCPDLQKVPDDTTKLSDVLNVVSDNYAQYKICKIEVDNWIVWYNTQKKVYEGVK
jgi:hypothetical protein